MGARQPPSSPEESDSAGEPLSFPGRVRRTLFGGPKSLADSSLFHRLTLVPFLAWVGLGADGLSSSAYGPDEALPHPGRAHLPAAGAGPDDHRHRAGDLGGLQAHHRGVPPRRRRLRRGHEAAGPERGRRLGLRPARGLRADDHGVDRRGRRRHLQLPAAGLARREAGGRGRLRAGAHRAEHPGRARVGDGPAAGVPGVPADARRGHPGRRVLRTPGRCRPWRRRSAAGSRGGWRPWAWGAWPPCC